MNNNITIFCCVAVVCLAVTTVMTTCTVMRYKYPIAEVPQSDFEKCADWVNWALRGEQKGPALEKCIETFGVKDGPETK